jgi:hypothetical protein
MSRRDLIARGRRALQRGDAAAWEAAEVMAELYDLGDTQRVIAEELGCSPMTVSNYVAVWHEHDVYKKKPSFSDALKAVRGGWGNEPKTADGRAQLAAKLLKDKAVADAPVVRKVEERHAERRHRADMAEWNRERGVPTRTNAERDKRRLSVVMNDSFWFRTLTSVKQAKKALTDAIGELDRTGIPQARSGELIRDVRALARAAERFEEAANSTGVGKAM